MPGKFGGLKPTEVTNIRVSKEVREEFAKLGKYGENASNILERLVKFYNEYHNANGDVIFQAPSLYECMNKNRSLK